MRAVQQSISDFSNAAGAESLASCKVEAWRPLPPQVADITCLSRVGYTISPHAFEWLGLTLVLSSVTVQRESRGSIEVAAGTILVVPAGEVLSMRAAGREERPPIGIQALPAVVIAALRPGLVVTAVAVGVKPFFVIWTVFVSAPAAATTTSVATIPFMKWFSTAFALLTYAA